MLLMLSLEQRMALVKWGKKQELVATPMFPDSIRQISPHHNGL
jgi:hypothetical protein